MVGLGNSRRGMKSPPLLVAALVATIIVLGFNYWMASSRGVALQSRIMELEGRVRRGVAERGAVELKKNEFQGELKKQREQIDKIQSLHDFQMENMNKMHRDEKEMLLNNITADKQLIQNLQEHLKKMQKQYENFQLEIYRFQKNYTNLQRKFTFDMSQCISKVKELKEQCEEKIEVVSPKDSKIQEAEKEDISNIPIKNYQANPEIPTLGQAEFQNHDLTNEENEPQEKNIPNDSVKLESKQTSVINNIELDYHKEKGTSDVMNEEPRKEEFPIEQEHPETPSMLSRDQNAMPPKEDTEQNPYEEVSNVAAGEVSAESQTGRFTPPLGHQTMNEAKADEEEIEREELLNDDLQQSPDEEPNGNGEFQFKKVNQDNRGEDYNLDTNEAESETDKQAALVNHQHNLNAQNLQDPKMESHLFQNQKL